MEYHGVTLGHMLGDRLDHCRATQIYFLKKVHSDANERISGPRMEPSIIK